MWIFWLVLLVVALIAEIATVNLVSVWFAIGAVVALIADLFLVEVWLQIVLFFAVSILGIIVFLLVFKPKMDKSKEINVTTNADRILGEEGVVIVPLEPLKNLGQIRVLGQVWSAIPQDENSTVELDTLVRVVEIKGVKAVVTPAEEKQ